MEQPKIYLRDYGNRKLFIILLSQGYVFCECVKQAKKWFCFHFKFKDDAYHVFLKRARSITLDEIKETRVREYLKGVLKDVV